MPAGRHRARDRGNRGRQAHRDGQCRSRCARRRVLARKARAAGVIYSHGLRRSACADLPRWSTGRAPPASASRRRAKARNICRPITRSRRTRYGSTTASPPQEAKQAGMNSQMFNSFLDGTKSAIEMAAVANACGLDVPHDGLQLPAVRRRRPRRRAAAAAVGRRARRRRHGRGRLLAQARRGAGAARSALGRLCGVQGCRTTTRRRASSNMGCRPMPPDVMPRCTSPTI